LWETYENDENMLDDAEDHQSMIDDVDPGGILMMEVEVKLDYYVSAPGAGCNEDSWCCAGISGGNTRRVSEKLPSFNDDYEVDYEHDFDETDYSDEDEAPRTPLPAERLVVRLKCENNVHEITPEQQALPKVNLPDLVELQLKCQLTLKKLASSMRRSHETRSIVKRQHLQSPVFTEDVSDSNMFSTQRARAMEESRRKIYQMINMGVLSTMDSRF
jgi:hypothetical protein